MPSESLLLDRLVPFETAAKQQDMDDNDEEESEPPSTAGSAPSGRDSFPYAVFAPEPGPGFTRAFRWGRADAADGAHSDLPVVREAVVNATEWLRTTTREVVYERFRTERLLTARGAKTLRV